ncbi:MAG: glycosyltransferase family 1 protein [Lachnospiraceae bacterium]|nr:glycosyltransferase family 1 protein [Lachnospiraceae bacterium]
MKKIVINGQFLARRITGQERFALETVLELDKLIKKNSLELIVPTHVQNLPQLDNIKTVKFGSFKGSLWEQLDFSRYVVKNRALSLNLCSVMPIIEPGIICIHDLSYKVNPHYCKHVYGKISQIWHKLFFNLAWKFSPIIYTVSEYSKKQMIDIYNVKEDKIHVIANGWQHFKRIEEDDKIFEKWPRLEDKKFYFMVGSLSPNKNLEWIYGAAKNNTEAVFAVAGNVVAYGNRYSHDDSENVLLLGYVSDSEMKSLMSHCKAFIFPSFFEGFGIPPLEAMSVGAKVLVSNTSCLPEIYKDSAIYIDPYNFNVDLEKMLTIKTESADKILKKYDYKNSAISIYNDLLVFNRTIENQHKIKGL